MFTNMNTSDWASQKETACADFFAKNPSPPISQCQSTAIYQGTQYKTCRVNSGYSVSGNLCLFQGNSPWVAAQGGSMANVTYTFTVRTVECSPVCQQGEKQNKNIRIGYGRYTSDPTGAVWRTTDGRGYFRAQGPQAPPPNEMCDGACAWVADGGVVDNWYNTNPTATGLFELFAEQGYTKTGASCSAATPAANPNATPPACDGFMGEINGKTVCVAKEPPGASAAAGAKGSVTGAGSTPSASTDTSAGRTGPNGETPGKTMDIPGVPDLSGTGVKPGSTPSTNSGTGVVDKPDEGKEQAACGAPGQPPCKIDESGTPSGDGKFNGADQRLTQAEADAKGLVTSALTKTAPGWTWTFQLPTGCTALQTPAFEPFMPSINLCQWQDTIHELMSLVWLAVTIWACIGMVGSTLRSA